MTPTTIAIVIVVVSIACISVGIQGLSGAKRTIQASGPNTLMHYPAPVPWLRRKVTAARWVSWIGRLYLVAGISGFTAAWIVGTSLPNQHSTQKCQYLADVILTLHPAKFQGSSIETTALPTGCRSRVLDRQRVRWFEISSTSSQHRMAQDFLDERQKLNRLTYTIKPIDGLGSRAALAQSKPGSKLNPILMFTDSDGHHRIEMNAITVDEAAQGRLISLLEKSLRSEPAH